MTSNGGLQIRSDSETAFTGGLTVDPAGHAQREPFSVAVRFQFIGRDQHGSQVFAPSLPFRRPESHGHVLLLQITRTPIAQDHVAGGVSRKDPVV
jgi:hypothetical protein